MITTVLMTILAAAIAGLATKYALDRWAMYRKITLREYFFGMIVISLVIVPVTGYIGWKLVQSYNLQFNEYWNGWETAALEQEIVCTQDGPCRWEYSCDPYSCNPHNCNCFCISYDSEGNCTLESCDTCYDTCYHDCPYVTHEFNYIVQTTLGNYNIAEHVMPANPQAHIWRTGHAIPQNVIQQAGTNPPPFWTGVKKHLERNEPGPVTARRKYDNYVLASEWTIIRESADDIALYADRGLLPPLNSSIRQFYRADKVYFIGPLRLDGPAWNESVSYLNAKLGAELQGDLHMVVVRHRAGEVQPDTYELALHAHWLDKERFGKDVLAKNALVVVLGTTDGETVAWSRAFTGMPKGNEHMIAAIESVMPGLKLDPYNIPATLEHVLWGIDDTETRFVRVRMKGPDGKSGYLYLQNEIVPSRWQQACIFTCAFILCLIMWLIQAYSRHPLLQ